MTRFTPGYRPPVKVEEQDNVGANLVKVEEDLQVPQAAESAVVKQEMYD